MPYLTLGKNQTNYIQITPYFMSTLMFVSSLLHCSTLLAVVTVVVVAVLLLFTGCVNLELLLYAAKIKLSYWFILKKFLAIYSGW